MRFSRHFLASRLCLACTVRAGVRICGLGLTASAAAWHVVSADSTTRPQAARDSSGLLTARKSGKEALLEWGSGTLLDRLNRADHTEVDPNRRVIVVVGITGAGKSSTSNTLAGRTHKQFALSSSITSVTQAVAFRDYDFLGQRWRVVDTPGLFDTNRSEAAVREEVLRLARYTKHGVSAFVVVVPRGRITPEHEQALRQVVQLFGGGMYPFSLVAVTSATDMSEGMNLLPRDQLIEEVNALPLHHFFRDFVERVAYRLVPVENRLDTQKQISRNMLHQRVLAIEDSNGGARYDVAELLRRADTALTNAGTSARCAGAAADRNGAAEDGATGAHGNSSVVDAVHPPLETSAGIRMWQGITLGPCTQTFSQDAGTGEVHLTMRCRVVPDKPQATGG